MQSENVSVSVAEDKGEIQLAPTEESKTDNTDTQSSVAGLPFKLPFGLDTDDILLIAVLFLVLSESDDNDFFLPLILGYLLLTS